MAKDRRKDPSGATRQQSSGRGWASSRKEKEYIKNTKSRLGDEQALLDHCKRHEPGATNPCRVEICYEILKFVLLDLLKRYEITVPIAPDLRELRAAITELVVGAERCAAILNRLIPSVRDGDVVQIARDYFDDQRQSNEKIKSLLFAAAMSDPFVEVLAERPLHRYREFATLCSELPDTPTRTLLTLSTRAIATAHGKGLLGAPSWTSTNDRANAPRKSGAFNETGA